LSALAVSILVKPSRLLLMLAILMLSLATLSLLYVAFVFYEQIVFYSLVVVIVFVWVWIYQALRQQSFQIYQIDFDDQGGMVLREFDGALRVTNSQIVFLRSPVIIWPHLIVLSVVREDGKKQRLIIAFDSVGCEGFRQLAVVSLCLARRAQRVGDERNGVSEGNF
jgi:hypothetical protein